MLMQTLKLMGNHWCDSPRFIPRFMKGLFNSIPPVPELMLYWTYSRSQNGIGKIMSKFEEEKLFKLIEEAMCAPEARLYRMLDCSAFCNELMCFILLWEL